jgi:hypothetical protein
LTYFVTYSACFLHICLHICLNMFFGIFFILTSCLCIIHIMRINLHIIWHIIHHILHIHIHYYIFCIFHLIHTLHILHMNKERVIASGVSFFASAMLIAWSQWHGPAVHIPPPTSVTAALCLITTCAQKISWFSSHLEGGRSSIAHRDKRKPTPVWRILEQHTKLELIHCQCARPVAGDGCCAPGAQKAHDVGFAATSLPAKWVVLLPEPRALLQGHVQSSATDSSLLTLACPSTGDV